MTALKPNNQVVLSLFPGADLFGKAFESRGFCVVRGPELLLGQDIRDFHAPAGRFDGVIGGPPCQRFSTASAAFNEKGEDLIGEFARILNEAQPAWAVMENVNGALRSPHLPDGSFFQRLRDFDCGGLTHRKRLFWLWPESLWFSFQLPARKRGKPEYSVLASQGRRGNRGNRIHQPAKLLKIPEGARLQGFPELADNFMENGSTRRYMTHEFGIHLLGNGVPRAMGEWVADQVAKWLEKERKE